MERGERELWGRVAPLLDELLVMEPGEARRRRVDELAQGDPEIAAELQALLAGADSPPSWLDAAWSDREVVFERASVSAEDSVGDPRLGQVVGGYRLVERLGQGGMATVYRGTQQQEAFEHEVAVKLLRPGVVSEGLLERFRDEQRILSSLNHPNIAHFYGGGVADDGQPYILMERVEGLPLDRYCDENHLDVEARLSLFRQVCDAVAHAHSRLVVHRDLKHSNLMVTHDGTVKVLDFGIAKLLGQSEELTAEYGVPMTPAFAAPEQLRAQPATTATDVYALGIVLYDLLAGSRPFRMSEGLLAVQVQQLREATPERPSYRVRRLAASSEALSGGERDPDDLSDLTIGEIAARRSTTPTGLRRRLAGDLDVLVLKALHRDPARRYSTAASLGDDIERYLGTLPIQARPDSWTYTLGRFVRRNRLASALAVLLLLSLVGGLWLAIEGQRAAEREAATSARVVEFLVDAFRTADPNFGAEGDVTAIAMVERAAEKLQTELEEEPEERARMLQVLAESSLALGDFDGAEELAQESVRLHESTWGRDDPRTLAARNVLATIYRDSGQVHEADAVFRDVLERERRLRGGSDLHGTIANEYGTMQMEIGELDSSEGLLQTALDIHRRRGVDGETELIRTLNNLALLRRRQGDLATTEALLTEVLDRLRASRSSPAVDVATAVNNLASLARQQGDLERAESLFREALEIRRSVLDAEHPDVAQSHNNLGAVLYSKEDFAGAGVEFEAALAIWRDLFEGDHPRLASGLYNVGSLYRIQGRLDDALVELETAAGMQERLRGPDDPVLARMLRRWGVTLTEVGRPAEAVPKLERAVRILTTVAGPEDDATRAAAEDLAQARAAASNTSGSTDGATGARSTP